MGVFMQYKRQGTPQAIAKGAVAFSADQRAKQKEKDYISRSLSKPRLPMKYSLCLLMESKNNFALLSVFLPTRGIYIQLRGKENAFCI